MSDRATVVMALSAAAGAWAARPLPLWVPVAVVIVAIAWRRPLLLCVGVAAAASVLAARSWDGLNPPATGKWSGTATLVGDPADRFGALRVDLRIGGKRVEAWARGGAAGRLRPRLAGERVQVTGHLSAVPGDARVRLARRHVAARLTVSSVGDWSGGDLPSRMANGLRRTLFAGTDSMPSGARALFAGFVLGDDREQSPEVIDDFRASGLSHLLVVSGQNLAFVLALLAPVLQRLPLRGRFAVGILAVGLFGVLTRWEPSVMRAAAMASVALLASTMGRPVSRLRSLALAVTAVLLVDPLLVGSVGFLLSVGACTGIALFGARLTEAIPGPRPLAAAIAVTTAAQIGVAPVLVPLFDGLPVAAIPANLVALPVAGPLVMWGMAAGLPAGVLGGHVAALVHFPTGLAVTWIAAVARWGAAAPLGRLGPVHVLVLAGLAAAVWLSRRLRSSPTGRAMRAGALAVAVAVGIVLPAVGAIRPSRSDGELLAPETRLWHDGLATVVVAGKEDGSSARTTSAGQILSGLRARDVRRIDVLVVTRPGRAVAREIAPVVARFPPRLLLAPSEDDLLGAVVPYGGQAVIVGDLEVVVGQVQPRFSVSVHRRTPA